MKIVTAFNVISQQVTKHGNELKKLEYDINAGATGTGVWVQLHDFPTPVDLASGATAPADGSVPKKSWYSAAGSPNNYKDFTRGEMTFNYGVFVCVSTTEATLTLGTGSNKFDMVSAEVINEEVAGTTEVQASAAASKTIWSEATGAAAALRLLRVACKNNDAGIRYLMLFGHNTPIGGQVPISQWTLQASGDPSGLDTKQIDFTSFVNGSVSGLVVAELLPRTINPNKTGCTFAISTTAGSYTAGASANFYGEYK